MKAAGHVPTDSRRPARITGVALIAMALAAFFTYGYAHGTLVQPGDAAATFRNLSGSSLLFKAEILGWIFILVTDVVVAWGLYLVLKPVHAGLSLLAALLRLGYSALLGVAICQLLMALALVERTGQGGAGNFSGEQPVDLVMLFLDGFERSWSAGLIVFGGHLLLVGWIVWQARPKFRISRTIAILLLLGGVGYLAIHVGQLLLGADNGLVSVLTMVFMAPMVVGELGLGIWLLLWRKSLRA